MIEVVTGNSNLKFRCQGQLANSDKPIRVRVNHDVQCKLNDGSLKIYQAPKPKPVPKPEPKAEVEKTESKVEVDVKKETKKVQDK